MLSAVIEYMVEFRVLNMTDKLTQLDLSIERIVLLDLSFEAPMGQDVFTREWQPDYKIKLRLRSRDLPDEQWEVVLLATVTASLDDSVAFLIEAEQAGVFSVDATDPEAIRRVLSVEAPKLIFPYLREAVDGIAVKGGFPAVRMQSADFDAWYDSALQAERASGDGAATTGQPDTDH